MNMAVSRRSVLAGLLGDWLIPRHANAATIDADGMLQIDGRRSFMLGLYQTPNGSDGMRAAADAGFKVIQGKPDRAFLDKAHAHGLSSWLATGSDPAGIRKIVA